MLRITQRGATYHIINSATCYGSRSLGVSATACGRKSRDPYDRRFGIHPKDAGPNKPGGTREFQHKISRGGNMPQVPGFYTKQGQFVLVKEMIPEFVVPDLTNFALKPYVSYRVPDITQSEFTAQDLFDSTYAKTIVEDFTAGKLDAAGIKERTDKIKSTSKTDDH